jgi:hypothetical protein
VKEERFYTNFFSQMALRSVRVREKDFQINLELFPLNVKDSELKRELKKRIYQQFLRLSKILLIQNIHIDDAGDKFMQNMYDKLGLL